MLYLSNTATPKYFAQFRELVVRGEIPVCKEISMEMYRIQDLIDNPGIYYDPQPVECFIKFCEAEMCLTDGSPLKMLDTFKLWAEQVFGWYYFVEKNIPVLSADGHSIYYEKRTIKKRLIKRQFLIVGRGAAKSIYASCIHSFFLNVYTETSDQIVTAPTIRQADETLAPIRTAITRSRGPLFKFLTEGSLQNTTGSKANRVKLASTKLGIQNFLNGSIIELRPMSIDKLQGLRVKVASVDEWLSGDIRENVIECLEQGAAKEQSENASNDYFILATSSEGTVRNACGDDIKKELLSILKGEYEDPYTSIWYYKLDDIKEVNNPSMWLKANPNIGKTVSFETYQQAKEKAEKVPSERNDILAKRFGIPLEGYTYFFTYDETLPTSTKRDFWEMRCSMGVDLSRGDDFCAFTFLFPLGDGRFGVKTRCYISASTYTNLPQSMRNKYDEFISEDSLRVMDGAILDMMDVYDDLDNYIAQSKYDVCCVGYDPYNAKDFIGRWGTENGPFGIVKVIQGARTESVPLGEIKKLAEERALIFDQEILKFTMGNCITIEDSNGNRKLYKRRNDQKIDSVAAMMDALVAYKINREAFD